MKRKQMKINYVFMYIWKREESECTVAQHMPNSFRAIRYLRDHPTKMNLSGTMRKRKRETSKTMHLYSRNYLLSISILLTSNTQYSGKFLYRRLFVFFWKNQKWKNKKGRKVLELVKFRQKLEEYGLITNCCFSTST